MNKSNALMAASFLTAILAGGAATYQHVSTNEALEIERDAVDRAQSLLRRKEREKDYLRNQVSGVRRYMAQLRAKHCKPGCCLDEPGLHDRCAAWGVEDSEGRLVHPGPDSATIGWVDPADLAGEANDRLMLAALEAAMGDDDD